MSSSRASSSQNDSAPKDTITGHHGHPGHKLNRAEKHAMLHNCKDCKSQIFGMGSCYKCTDCKGYVHQACLQSNPNSSKPHPFIPNFYLKFSVEKSSGKVLCSACCSYVEGIMYTGCHANKTYRLHPHCIRLPRNSPNGLINSQLCNKIPKSIKCMFCETSDEEGWSYCVTENGVYKFGCHVRCLKTHLANEWFRKLIPVEMASREAYFESLYKRDLQKITAQVCGLGLEVAAVGLDLTISSFVGVPLSTFLSVALGVSVEVAKSKLEAFEKKLG